MWDSILIARNLHFSPIFLSEDVMLAMVLAFHFEKSLGRRRIVCYVNKHNSLRLQVSLNTFHLFNSDVAGAAPSCPKIHKHSFAWMACNDLLKIGLGLALWFPKRICNSKWSQLSLQFTNRHSVFIQILLYIAGRKC